MHRFRRGLPAKHGLLTILAAIGFASTATAAYSWTGCYVGVAGGESWGQASNTSIDPILPGALTGNYKLTGEVAGGTLGCNYQLAAFVFGIEGDASWTNKQGSVNALSPFSTTTNVQTRESWIGTARGRLGYVFSNSWLLYVTGGEAWTRATDNIADAGFAVSASDAETRWGWTAGGGIEVAFTLNWSAKIEYLYADFGSADYFVPHVVVATPGAGPYTFLNQSMRLTDNILRIGLNYKFF
jgi:outer membrane immunogenic protein